MSAEAGTETGPGGADTVSATGEAQATPERAAAPRRTIVLGSVGSLLVLAGGMGAAAGAVNDPIMADGPISWLRYGHGKMAATIVVYAGIALLVWAWVRLGRQVLAGRAGTRPVLIAAGCWMAPLLVAPALLGG